MGELLYNIGGVGSTGRRNTLAKPEFFKTIVPKTFTSHGKGKDAMVLSIVLLPAWGEI